MSDLLWHLVRGSRVVVVPGPGVHADWVGRTGTVERVDVSSFGHTRAAVLLDDAAFGPDPIEFPEQVLAHLLH